MDCSDKLGTLSGDTDTDISTAASVKGPTSFASMESVLSRFLTTGFQASHFGQAIKIARKGLEKQGRSRQYVVRDGEFVEVRVEEEKNIAVESPKEEGLEEESLLPSSRCEKEEDFSGEKREEVDLVRPLWFLGMTAQLMGTGCREAVRFLVQEGVEPKKVSTDPTKTNNASADTVGKSVPEPYSSQSFGYDLYERIGMKDMRENTKSPSVSAAASDDLSSLVVLENAEECAYHSFLSCLVVSGGGMEHDIRRACEPYHLISYSSEDTENAFTHMGRDHAESRTISPSSASNPPTPGDCPTRTTLTCFGNVSYPSVPSPIPTNSNPSLYDLVMRIAVRRLRERQERLRHQSSMSPIPSDPYFDQCTWNLSPSEIWGWIGWHLPLLFTEALATMTFQKDPSLFSKGQPPMCSSSDETKTAFPTSTASIPFERVLTCHPEILEEAKCRARSTVVYWAAQQGVPIFSPSFADGDIMDYTLGPPTSGSGAVDIHHGTVSSPEWVTTPTGISGSLLDVDLVRDIHSINKMAMTAGRTGVLICGGGVVKHHICNANLMRNGSDFTIFMNNGQEFDGSDAGAKPEEAVSWGKIRIDGEHVKVYGEVTAVFPLFVGEVFLDAVRKRGSPSSVV